MWLKTQKCINRYAVVFWIHDLWEGHSTQRARRTRFFITIPTPNCDLKLFPTYIFIFRNPEIYNLWIEKVCGRYHCPRRGCRVFFLQESKVATFWGHLHFLEIRRNLLRVWTQRKKYPPHFGVSWIGISKKKHSAWLWTLKVFSRLLNFLLITGVWNFEFRDFWNHAKFDWSFGAENQLQVHVFEFNTKRFDFAGTLHDCTDTWLVQSYWFRRTNW